MTTMEQMELNTHCAELSKDVQKLVEKYRAIFEWDIPEIDELRSDKLIIAAIRQALDEVDNALGGTTSQG